MANVFTRLFRWFRGDAPSRRRSTYDAAEDQKELQKHWEAADALSAAALNTPDIRARLRNRARYEVRNNSYAAGLLSTIASDLIGTGPRLQLGVVGEEVDQGRSKQFRSIERAFAAWGRGICLAEKLRILHESRLRDGECFAVLKTNPELAGPVKLDIALIETDQCASPWDRLWNDEKLVDGIEFDAEGNRTRYHFLKTHPGSPWRFSLDTTAIEAASVIHWYRPTRPGQVRGVSELAPALNLFAQLRRYTMAVITNAETAAHLTGILESDLSPDTGATPTFGTMDEVELPRGALLTTPRGWKANSFQPGQPHQRYENFKESLLNEIGRCINAPLHIVAGSWKYNFSSARMDAGIYQRSHWVERSRLHELGLDRISAAWLDEAMLTRELAPLFRGLPPFAEWTRDWQWDGFDSIDPVKDASAEAMELQNNTNTLAEICAAKGRHWEDVLAQRAREKARLKERGLAEAPPPAATTDPDEDEETERERRDAPEDQENAVASA